MSQVTNYTIPGSPLNMMQLAASLNAMFAASVSANRGASAPANPFEGMLWWDTSADPVETLKRYTVAAGWVSLADVNISTGTVSFYRAGVALGTMAVEAATDYIKNTLMTTQGDIIYASAANTPARLPKGLLGYYLKQGAAAPEWAAIPSPPTDGSAATPSLRTLGTGAAQACAGNDARLSNTRTPTDGTVTSAKVSSTIKDAAATTASLRTLGVGANQACAGNDVRLALNPTAGSTYTIGRMPKQTGYCKWDTYAAGTLLTSGEAIGGFHVLRSGSVRISCELKINSLNDYVYLLVVKNYAVVTYLSAIGSVAWLTRTVDLEVAVGDVITLRLSSNKNSKVIQYQNAKICATTQVPAVAVFDMEGTIDSLE